MNRLQSPRWPRRVLAAALLLGAPNIGAAQATPLVAPAARVSADIDRLAAAGLIDTILVGIRPYSRRDIMRMLTEARKNIDRLGRGASWAEVVVRGDLALYAPRSVQALDEATAGEAYLDNPARSVPRDGNGSLDATINPLAAGREGRPLDQRFTQTFETFHSAELGSHLALQLNPRLTLPAPESPSVTRALDLQSGGAHVLLGNVSIEAGRDYVVFGPGPDGGLLLSNNAPAVPLVRLANDVPVVLPGWLRRVGPVRGTLFVADFGLAHQIFPHSQLIGYHLAVEPTRHLELGAGLIDEMGGQGAPAGSFAQRVVDLFPPIKNFTFSNKMAAFDAHWRMPAWDGFEAYLESSLDDFDVRRIRSSFLEDGGWLGGIALSCLTECGRVGVRAEYRQTGIRFYTHGQFASGVQEGGVILGDPLGPRGLGTYVTVDGDGGSAGALVLTGAFEVRSGNLYGTIDSQPNDRNFHFVQLAHRPAEKRIRALVSWSPAGARDARLSARLAGGVERVQNFNYTGAHRANVLGEMSILFRP